MKRFLSKLIESMGLSNSTHTDIATEELQNVLDRSTESGRLRGVVALVADHKGIRFQHASGEARAGVSMKPDMLFNIASMTKLVTTIAVLQQVEAGDLDLDIPVDRYLPELRSIQVLEGFADDGSPRLRPARSVPTTRELLTHTSGYVYEVWNANAFEALQRGLVASLFAGRPALDAPLAFDPGERWEYGIGIDWAGLLLEAISGENLMGYFGSHIFGPLEMIDTAFDIPEATMDRAVTRFGRGPTGLTELPEQAVPSRYESTRFYNGGGGLSSTVKDYSRLLRALLNGGELDGQRVLSRSMVDQMFTNQIGVLDAGVADTHMPNMSNPIDMAFGASGRWGLGFLLHPDGTPNGRKPGSASWGGIFNSYFWIDRTSDICVVLATQILPFYDHETISTLQEFERVLYDVTEDHSH